MDSRVTPDESDYSIILRLSLFEVALLNMNIYCGLYLFIIRMGGLYLGMFPLYIYVVYAHLIVI